MIKIATWCVIGTAGILSAGCYQNVKGCLDPKAKNLDVRADVSCCCVYPSLKWSLVGSCAGGSIAWNDTCSVDDEQWMVVSYEMVLSEVVVQLNGLSIRTDSSVRLRLTDGALIDVPDDIRILRGGTHTAVIPDFIAEGALRRVAWTMGIPYDGVVPSSFPDRHPMRSGVPWDSQKGYRIFYLQAIELVGGDTLTIELFQRDVDTVRWSAPTAVVGMRGQDINLTLEADFVGFLRAYRQHNWTGQECLRRWKSYMWLKQ